MTSQSYAEARTDELRRNTASEKEMADLADADALRAAAIRERGQKTLDLTDELLDEIEAVLVDQEVVDEFRQKGGQ